MRFKKLKLNHIGKTDMSDLLEDGAFMQVYTSEEGYEVRYTNLYTTGGVLSQGKPHFVVYWEASNLELIEGTSSTMCTNNESDPIIDSDKIDLNDAKRAARDHYASLTTDERNVGRICLRNTRTNRTGNFLKNDLANENKKLTASYIEREKQKLIKLVQERENDPYDNTPNLYSVEGIAF